MFVRSETGQHLSNKLIKIPKENDKFNKNNLFHIVIILVGLESGLGVNASQCARGGGDINKYLLISSLNKQ